MTELLTPTQMRAVEMAAIEAGEATGLELMERAGLGVVEAIFEEWPDLEGNPGSALVLCGPGNNGGDGYVIARLLYQTGWTIRLFALGDPDRLPPDAAANCQRWQKVGLVQTFADDTPDLEGAHGDDVPSLAIDALFGTGLGRPLPAVVQRIADHLTTYRQKFGTKTVAVDIPSGLSSDTGRKLGAAFGADQTVTFHRPKIGHYIGEGPAFCGKIRVCDIGLNSDQSAARLIDHLQAEDISMLKKHVHHHKHGHGHALVLSGPAYQTGAARLAARAALRVGAGLVTIGAPQDAITEHAAQLIAIMLRQVDGARDFIKHIWPDERINAFCVGPAFGLTQDRGELLTAVLDSRRPTVIDADALTLIARDQVLFGRLHSKCVLTPHAGEFARLFPDIAKRLNRPAETGPAYSKVEAAREAAEWAGCVILLKGPDSVIADPAGGCSVNAAHYDRAAPWLATAGSGDVLAGFIAGLLARGLVPKQAAEIGAWLHVECARQFGPGLIAEDLPEQLPNVFSNIGL